MERVAAARSQEASRRAPQSCSGPWAGRCLLGSLSLPAVLGFAVTGLLLSVPCLCPQAAELVTENCEAYEAHMRDIRDYLEERLQVRGWPCPGTGQGRGGEHSQVPRREDLAAGSERHPSNHKSPRGTLAE